MFGLDDWLASLGGASMLLALAVAALLGLRHATDPDHLTAVATLIAGDRERGARRARMLGLAWGWGHALTLFCFGLPVVLVGGGVPDRVRQVAEVAVGILIALLAVRLLLRWHAGAFHTQRHDDAPGRSSRAAFGIGLVHGIGGSAGAGILLVGAASEGIEGVVALALFAAGTAVSMALASTGFGLALARGTHGRRFEGVVPALGACSLLFGVWYALGALHTVPYVF